MQFQISVQNGAPIYQQIVEQVKLLVAGGRLKAGDDVPPIRVLAEQLRINPNTVARAYLELERAGLITMRQGFGTTVAQMKSPLSPKEKLKILARSADALLADARHLNVPLEEVIKLLREREASMQPESTQ
jgi:GntR family transcriptional regulator